MENTPVKRVTRATAAARKRTLQQQDQGPAAKKRAYSSTVGKVGEAMTGRLSFKENLLLSKHGLAAGSPANSLSPLPALNWTDSVGLWTTMRAKDTIKLGADSDLLIRHPGIVPNMRVILLDWLLEVCEEYKLHRETYYLAKDMYDRLMDTRHGVHKEELQLIGVTCLFIAAKIEEIYPPKVGDFAYVTDGACTVGSILNMELIICKSLKWRLNHSLVTVNTWVNTYLQLGSKRAKTFEFPVYSPVEFCHVMGLLDLATLDTTSRGFPSSILAATAVYLTCERSQASLKQMTGYDAGDLRVCVSWMLPYANVHSQKPVPIKTYAGVLPEDAHNIQTHDITISMLDEARSSPPPPAADVLSYNEPSVFMTPPRSERRCLAPINTH